MKSEDTKLKDERAINPMIDIVKKELSEADKAAIAAYSAPSSNVIPIRPKR